MRRSVRVVALTLTALSCVIAGTGRASAEQKRAMVRVTRETASVRLRPDAKADLLKAAPQGTLLEAMDRQDDWYWVMMAPDENGSRLPGWISASDVDLVEEGDAAMVLRQFSEAIQAAKQRDQAAAAKEAAAAQARLDRARARLEKARQDYDAAQAGTATKAPKKDK